MVRAAVREDRGAMTTETPPPQGGTLPPPQPPTGRPRWYDVPVARDRHDGKLGGVIAGLGRSYGFELKLVRVLFALACLFFPSLVLVYIGAWIVLPAEAGGATSFRTMGRQLNRMSVGTLVVLGFIALTVLVTLDSPFHARGLPWGLALVIIGVLLWMGTDRFTAGAGPTPAAAGPTPLRPDGTAFRAPAPTPRWAPAPPTPSSWEGATRTYPTVEGAPLTLAPVRPRYPVFSVGAALTFVVVGVAALGDLLDWWHLSILGTAVTALLALALLAVVSAGVNRSVAPLLLVGPLAFATAALLVVQPNLSGGVGERVFTPVDAAEAGARQRLAAGRLTVDLRSVPVGEQPVRIDARVGFGQLRVLVPAGTTVDVRAEVGAGHVVVDGDELGDGVRIHVNEVERPTRAGGPTVIVDAEVGAGELTVERAGIG